MAAGPRRLATPECQRNIRDPLGQDPIVRTGLAAARTPPEVSSFYDVEEYYTHGNAQVPDQRGPSIAQRVLTRLSWIADKGVEPLDEWWSDKLGRKPLRILEIGCGGGTNLKVFERLGYEAVGVEPDPNAISAARRAGLKVFQGTAEALPPEVRKGTFDAVVFFHVLEHCVDPGQALKNAVKLLAPSGLFVAEVPNNACAGKDQFGVAWYWLDVPRHLNFFTAESLTELLVSEGLRIEDQSFRGYCRQFSPEWMSKHRHIASVLGQPEKTHVRDLRYWFYLARTAMSRDARKYDSVRLVARAP